MAVSYKKLWKLLIDKDMKKKDLLEKAHISSYTLNKLNRCENVNVDLPLCHDEAKSSCLGLYDYSHRRKVPFNGQFI